MLGSKVAFFMSGVTIAFFIVYGTSAFCSDRFTMLVIGVISSSTQSFSKDVGMGSSSQVADDEAIIIFLTSSVVAGEKLVSLSLSNKEEQSLIISSEAAR